jgi:tetratricopeptide (TPR) repeat protein
MQYQALMLHRQAMQVANNSEKSEMLSLGAISWIDAAIRLCRSPFTKNREALLSETLHLKGVMNLQVAKFYYFDKKIKTIDQAKKLFDEALEQQEKFCKKTVTTPYFMQATTLQSLSKIFLENKQFDEAILCLSNALNIQKTIFGKDRPHKDIAKTLHFLGDAFLAKGDVEKAAKNYLMALVMKAKINYNQKDMVTVTQDALVKSLAAITDTEKKSALQQKIWQEFSDPVNVKQFINSVDTLKKLREKILPDVKLHSVQAADKQQHRLFAKKSISLAEPIPSVRFGKK